MCGLKKHIQTYILIVLFFAYVVSLLFNSNLWGNILSPTVAFVAAAIIWLESKKVNTYQWSWRVLFLVALSWGITDFAWLFTEHILLIDPHTISIFIHLYLVSNIMIAIFCGLYFYYNIKKWNTVQLLLDVIAIGTIIIVSIWMIMFSKMEINSLFNEGFIATFLYLFFDFISISIILIVYTSSHVKNVSRAMHLIIASIIIFVLCDLYFIYLNFADKYVANTLIDGFYMLTIVFIAFAAMEEAENPSKIVKVCKLELPENYGRPKVVKWLFSLPFILYILGIMSRITFIHIVGVIIAYWLIRGYVQTAIKNEHLLKTEKQLNDILDQTVQERTKELIKVNETLNNLSKTDALTGLYNRRYFIEYVDSLIDSPLEKSFAIFYMDLDRFKAVNDAHGHEMGDNILRKIAARLEIWCPPDATLFRVGGDEFAMIVEGDTSEKLLNWYAKEIVKLCEKTILIPPYSFQLGVSVGISRFPTDADERNLLIKYADIAMYQCKKNYLGKRFAFFDSWLSKEIQRKHEIELLLRHADFKEEFKLYYQPQYRSSDNTLVGMEALIRWNSPSKGFIFPGEFIPIAEETSMIIRVGEWVLDEALRQIKNWNEKYSQDLKIGINISPKQIDQEDFINWLKQKIRKSGVKPEWIDLEITENSAMSSETSMEELFTSLAEIDINISIDDFGTGYSSLSYIKRFDIDRLKIAKELIDNIASDKNTLLIVKAIIMMANGLGLKTIAEGVEEEEQLKILKELSCDEIQGYIYGHPVPADVFEREYLVKSVILEG
ncbi:diguanylate cyclase/phosphodiesterase [Clostridium aceticum]|uniref:Diguanylate cyclase/phosphodiesterase n=1 Tax=Clostridium aceticum TaxID=84022 RepID=A0A0D8IA62_9CLOT|nr:EAL domain-containing protein [Clostridium aceticum]AKL96309.1 diguanylate cyclase/phosphodiesterase [Clostridium aceticum]KJF26907.1 diguanylate cyclase [Clostridium aceticum]